MNLLQWFDAIMAGKERKRARLKTLIYGACPYYDSDYVGWNIDELIEKILEITDGKV